MVERQATEILQNTTAKRVREELAAVTGLQQWNDSAYWSYFLVPFPKSPFPTYYLLVYRKAERQSLTICSEKSRIKTG
jgi:hypothetical protein